MVVEVDICVELACWKQLTAVMLRGLSYRLQCHSVYRSTEALSIITFWRKQHQQQQHRRLRDDSRMQHRLVIMYTINMPRSLWLPSQCSHPTTGHSPAMPIIPHNSSLSTLNPPPPPPPPPPTSLPKLNVVNTLHNIIKMNYNYIWST